MMKWILVSITLLDHQPVEIFVHALDFKSIEGIRLYFGTSLFSTENKWL